MCNLMIFWLRICGIEEKQVEELASSFLQKLLLNCFDPVKADKIFSEAQVNKHIYIYTYIIIILI